MQKVYKIILALSILINLILLFIVCERTVNTKGIDKGVYLNKIDSLEYKIDSLKSYIPGIKEKIDTVYIKIHENNDEYEENCSIIYNNSVLDNYDFFVKYIEEYNSRYNSINNSNPTERS